ncbi:MAG: hypothetical protein QGH48_05505, partial [Candidatus Poseidoniia archaeon]|nr:hypothetical protein [Candidatus Poseidoniia archaeon]
KQRRQGGMKNLRIFLMAALFLVVFSSLEGVEADQEPIWKNLTTGEVYSMSTSSDGRYIVVGTHASKADSNS